MSKQTVPQKLFKNELKLKIDKLWFGACLGSLYQIAGIFKLRTGHLLLCTDRLSATELLCRLRDTMITRLLGLTISWDTRRLSLLTGLVLGLG